MVLFIYILLGSVCLWCLFKAICPSFNQSRRKSILHYEAVQPIEDSMKSDVMEHVMAPSQKKATVRIGLPPKPDANHTIRISLPPSSGNLGFYPSPVPAPVGIPAPEFIPANASEFLPPVEEHEEFLGSTRIITGPVIGRFYWLLGLNILSEFRGYAGMDQDYCFFHQGCLFYLDRGSHAIRLAGDQNLPNFMGNTGFENHLGDEIIKPADSLGASKTHDMDSFSVVQRMRVLTHLYEELLIENDDYRSKKAELLQQL